MGWHGPLASPKVISVKLPEMRNDAYISVTSIFIISSASYTFFYQLLYSTYNLVHNVVDPFAQYKPPNGLSRFSIKMLGCTWNLTSKEIL
jgi:hypothetical protein